eukprot:scaffold11218_cov140-Isochrysis_galbana.AAC.1
MWLQRKPGVCGWGEGGGVRDGKIGAERPLEQWGWQGGRGWHPTTYSVEGAGRCGCPTPAMYRGAAVAPPPRLCIEMWLWHPCPGYV